MLEQPVIELTASIGEAGRAILHQDYLLMRKYEAEAPNGGEPLHEMRTATKQIRILLQAFKPYYKRKYLRYFDNGFKYIGMALGRVEDFDKLIAQFDPQADQEVIQRLNKKRDKHYQYMMRLLNSKRYAVFMSDLEKFLTTAGRGSEKIKCGTIPTQVRHVLPVMIHQHLAEVKAFDSLIDNDQSFKFHVLTLRVKRLRLLLERFESLLGSSVEEYLQELGLLETHLCHVMDAKYQHRYLASVIKKQDKSSRVHLKRAKKQIVVYKAGFGEVWEAFNLRRVQQKLSTALLTLR